MRAGRGRRLLLATIATALPLAGVEAWYRLEDRPDFYAQLEEEQLENQSFPYQLNSWKLRDREYQSPKPEGHYRIMVLGDSFTFGTGVLDDRKVFPELLEQRLNEERPDPRVARYDVLNAGLPRVLTDEWVLAVKGPGSLFQPDMLVAVFFLRDGTTLGFRKDFFYPMQRDLRDWENGSWLARHSAAWRALLGKQRVLEASASYVDQFHRAYFGTAEETAEWRRAQEHLLWFRDVCRLRGASFHLVVFPVLFRLGPGYPFRDVCTEIERFGRASDIATFSLLPAFQDEDASTLWISELDQHPNERGHEIAATALEGYLRAVLTKDRN